MRMEGVEGEGMAKLHPVRKRRGKRKNGREKGNWAMASGPVLLALSLFHLIESFSFFNHLFPKFFQFLESKLNDLTPGLIGQIRARFEPPLFCPTLCVPPPSQVLLCHHQLPEVTAPFWLSLRPSMYVAPSVRLISLSLSWLTVIVYWLKKLELHRPFSHDTRPETEQW